MYPKGKEWFDLARSGEIDIIENYRYKHGGEDVNSVRTNFGQCGETEDTHDHCKLSNWDGNAGKVNHHVSVKTTHDPTDGRIIRVHHCENPQGVPLSTCDSEEFGEIKVTKPPPSDISREDWFRVWNKGIAKDRYAKYWFVTDIWWTSGTDFKLSVDNIRFFKADDSEWIMPLDGAPPSFDLTDAEIDGIIV